MYCIIVFYIACFYCTICLYCSLYVVYVLPIQLLGCHICNKRLSCFVLSCLDRQCLPVSFQRSWTFSAHAASTAARTRKNTENGQLYIHSYTRLHVCVSVVERGQFRSTQQGHNCCICYHFGRIPSGVFCS